MAAVRGYRQSGRSWEAGGLVCLLKAFSGMNKANEWGADHCDAGY